MGSLSGLWMISRLSFIVNSLGDLIKNSGEALCKRLADTVKDLFDLIGVYRYNIVGFKERVCLLSLDDIVKIVNEFLAFDAARFLPEHLDLALVGRRLQTFGGGD